MAAGYFPHFSSEAVYTGLLFKTGKKQKAVDVMLKASEDPVLKSKTELENLLRENA